MLHGNAQQVARSQIGEVGALKTWGRKAGPRIESAQAFCSDVRGTQDRVGGGFLQIVFVSFRCWFETKRPPYHNAHE